LDTILEVPKSHKVYFVLKGQIVSGDLHAGTRLASEPELASTYGVSRVTVRKALGNLEREGLIRRRPGAGTFVTQTGARRLISADLSDLLANIVAIGQTTRVRLLAFGYASPPSRVMEALGLKHGEKAQRSIRVRIMNKDPYSYLTTWVPESIGGRYSETDLASTPLLTLLERSGVEVARAVQSISATRADPEIASALNLEIGAPLLAVHRVLEDRNRRGVEYLQALYRPDRYEFTLELARAADKAGKRWQLAPATSSRQTKNPASAKSNRRGVKTRRS
jgi:GntR family transcriptional regulator